MTLNLNLELTDHCNIKCRMCSQSMRDKAHGVPMRFMDWATWRKSLQGLGDLQDEVALCPHWLGEPTLHPEFDRFVIVNAHGGNLDAVRSAAVTCEHEGRPISVWHARLDDADAHAGSIETSVMLAIDPQRVRLDQAEPGNTAPLREILDDLRTGGFAAVSPNGVLGDPTDATPARGEEILAEWVHEVVALLES